MLPPPAVPQPPEVPETPAAAGGWSEDFAKKYIIPAGAEIDDSNDYGTGLVSRMSRPSSPFVDFPYPDQNDASQVSFPLSISISNIKFPYAGSRSSGRFQ